MKAAAAVLVLFLLFMLLILCLCQENHASDGEGKSILVLIPFNTKSHKNMFVPLIKSLADRGHHLDVISMFSSPELENYPSVQDTVLKLGPDTQTLMSHMGSSIFKSTSSPYYGFLKSFSHFVDSCEHLMSLPQVRTLIRQVTRGQYKLVLFDAFMCECFMPLAHLADAPIIQVAPSHPMPWNYAAIGNVVNYAQDAVFFLPHDDKKSFLERLQAALMGTAAHIFRDWHFLPKIQKIVEKTTQRSLGQRKAVTIPPVWEIERERTALILVNWHWSLGTFVRSNPPTLVEVGTMHCREPKPLPQDLENFIQKSGDAGFILFSLGSTVPGHFMPRDLQSVFLKAFSQLPHRVLWKFEKEMDLAVPENVMVTPWLPQQDLLGDPRLRVFLTQAGMLSLQEAAWHGAPVIMAPLIVDQKANAAMARAAGLGLEMELHSATPTRVKQLILQVINNSSFSENARRLSHRLRDQPESASARAVWWVEYTIRHNGTRHLRPPAADLYWPQLCLLDVALLVGCVLSGLLWLAGAACKSACLSKKKIE